MLNASSPAPVYFNRTSKCHEIFARHFWVKIQTQNRHEIPELLTSIEKPQQLYCIPIYDKRDPGTNRDCILLPFRGRGESEREDRWKEGREREK